MSQLRLQERLPAVERNRAGPVLPRADRRAGRYRIQPIDLLALGWVVCVAVALFWHMRDWGYDDPYITYRYAANLADGLGFVYNADERVQSTTTPLYTLLLALFHHVGQNLPYASNLIGCVAFSAGALALWHLGRLWEHQGVALAGLLLYPTSPLLIPTLGAETALYLALVLLGFVAYAAARYSTAAALLALATLTRHDGVLAAVAIVVAYLTIHRRLPPWRPLLMYLAIIAPWYVFAWLYFGSALPATLAAKQQQGLLPISRSFLEGLVDRGLSYWSTPLYRLQLLIMALGAINALLIGRRWLLLIGWNLSYIAAYTLLGVTSYFWYYAPLAVSVTVLAGLGAQSLYHQLQRLAGRGVALGAGLLLILLLAWPQINTVVDTPPDRRLAIFRATGEWLRAHTPPGASLGTLEVGIIGYYAQRPMIDFAGLLQPETALRLTHGTGYEDAAIWATRRFRPDYLVLQEGHFPHLEHDIAHTSTCRVVRSFHDPAYPTALVIYQCHW